MKALNKLYYMTLLYD